MPKESEKSAMLFTVPTFYAYQSVNMNGTREWYTRLLVIGIVVWYYFEKFKPNFATRILT